MNKFTETGWDNFWRCLTCKEKLEPENECHCKRRDPSGLWKKDEELDKPEVTVYN